MVSNLKAKYEWCFLTLKCDKKDATNAVLRETAKTCRNKLFTSKQTTNKVPRNIFRKNEERKKIRLIYWRPKNSMKGKCYVFSDCKHRNNVSLLYLECKLQQDRYGWCISELTCKEMVEGTYLETSKQQTKYRWCF